MLNMFSESWQNLDKKISSLGSKIDSAKDWFNSYDKNKWGSIISLCEEIFSDFKTVRYPNKKDRDSAWQKYFHLKNDAYQTKNNQLKTLSSQRKSEIYSQLRYVDFDWLSDFLIGSVLSLGLLKTRADDMKFAGQKLQDAGKYFKSVKGEMTRDDKSEVHLRLVDIRKNHDMFWSRYKETSQAEYQRRKSEREQAWQEKQKAWEEKQEKSKRIRSRIENNLRNNNEKLHKAENALDRCRDSRRELQSKIYDSYNDDWKSKAEGWLDELDDKISDIENSIDRIKGWISEDSTTLDNWR